MRYIRFLLVTNDTTQLAEIKAALSSRFDMKDMARRTSSWACSSRATEPTVAYTYRRLSICAPS